MMKTPALRWLVFLLAAALAVLALACDEGESKELDSSERETAESPTPEPDSDDSGGDNDGNGDEPLTEDEAWALIVDRVLQECPDAAMFLDGEQTGDYDSGGASWAFTVPRQDSEGSPVTY